MGLGERLDAIRRQVSDQGVTVVVDLHGKLVDLAFTRDAMALRPGDLAGVVRRLAEEAAADALTEGLAVVAAVVPEGWSAEA